MFLKKLKYPLITQPRIFTFNKNMVLLIIFFNYILALSLLYSYTFFYCFYLFYYNFKHNALKFYNYIFLRP